VSDSASKETAPDDCPDSGAVSEKRCSRCKSIKPRENFTKSSSSKDGLRGQCRKCQHDAYVAMRESWTPERLEQHRKKNRELMRKRQAAGLVKSTRDSNPEWARRSRAKKFGLTLEQLELLEQDQRGLCAICNRPCGTGRSLAIDHCHESSVVRGLLCGSCNLGLGKFEDDIDRLEAAIRYVKERKSGAKCLMSQTSSN